jgi:hypothetical protein
MGDPYKRKKTIKFLIMTAIIGISAAAVSTFAQTALDGEKAEIPANIGFSEDCKKTLYTLTDDGTIYAEWEEEYPFEIGHFLWMWEFPLRDMDQSKSTLYVNGKESEHFISHPLQDGYHYKAEFTSKAYDESKDTDFLPEK